MPDHEAAALLVAARDAHRRGDDARAIRPTERVAPSTSEPALRIAAMLQLAGWVRERGDITDARACLTDAQDVLTNAYPMDGDLRMSLYATLTMEKGLLAHLAGDLDSALYLFDTAERMADYSEVTREAALVTVLTNRAGIELDAGRPDEARPTVGEALEIDQANGDVPHQVHDHHLLGRIHRAQGDEQAAHREFAVAWSWLGACSRHRRSTAEATGRGSPIPDPSWVSTTLGRAATSWSARGSHNGAPRRG